MKRLALLLPLLVFAPATADVTVPPVARWQAPCAARLERARLELGKWGAEMRVTNEPGEVRLGTDRPRDPCEAHAEVRIKQQVGRARKWRRDSSTGDKDHGGMCDLKYTIWASRSSPSRSVEAVASGGGLGGFERTAIAVFERAADDCLALP